MSLTVYQSKFVLVGGCHPSTREPTDIVLTSTAGEEWEPSLPPMPTKRHSTSSVSTTFPEVLVVVGGVGSDGKLLDVVEVLKDDKWTTVDPLPAPDYALHSTFHDGNLYFMGGQNKFGIIHACSCASLISSCEKSRRNTSNRRLWREFYTPDFKTTAISYPPRLVSINGFGTVCCYSSKHHPWIEVTSEGDRTLDYSSFIAASVLSTGDIVYAHGHGGIYKVTVSGEYIYIYECTIGE